MHAGPEFIFRNCLHYHYIYIFVAPISSLVPLKPDIRCGYAQLPSNLALIYKQLTLTVVRNFKSLNMKILNKSIR